MSRSVIKWKFAHVIDACLFVNGIVIDQWDELTESESNPINIATAFHMFIVYIFIQCTIVHENRTQAKN